MIVSLLALLAALGAGVLASTRVPVRCASILERIVIGAAIGFAFALWTPYLLFLAAGPASTRVAPFVPIALFAALLPILGREAWAKLRQEASATHASRGAKAFAVALFLLLGFLASRHAPALTPEGDLLLYGYSGDMPFHLSLASSFVYTGNGRPPRHPLFAGVGLAYPFVPDFHAGNAIANGASIHDAYFFPAWLALGATCAAIASLSRVVLSSASPYKALLAVVLFLAGNGFGFLQVWLRIDKTESVLWVLTAEDYASPGTANMAYGNMLASLLLPARNAAFGMTIAIACLILLARARDDRFEARAPLAVAGALGGALVLVHGQSWLALGFAAACFTVEAIVKRERFGRFAWFFVPFAIESWPQVLWCRSNIPIDDFVRVHWAWMTRATNPLEWFATWTRWCGVIFVVTIPAFLRAPRRTKVLAAPWLALFLIANVWRFSPCEYNNMKLFAYAHVVAAILVADALARLWSKGGGARALAVVLVALALPSGMLSILRAATAWTRIAVRDGIAFAEEIKEKTPRDAIFLTAPDNVVPASLLAGRTIVRGHDEPLRNMGLLWWEREDEVKAIYKGEPGASRHLLDFNVSYICVGPEERETLSPNEDFFRSIGHVVIEQGEYTCYEVDREAVSRTLQGH